MPRRRRHKKASPQNEELPDLQTDKNAPYIVKKSEDFGRYLVSSCDLPSGASIISEDALVVGPAQDSPPVCLGCYLPIPVDSAFKCKTCQWPMCSTKCKGLYKRLGHSKEECNTLESCKVESAQLSRNYWYNVIVPLRCLLLKEHHVDSWKALSCMEAQNDVRNKLPSIWDYNQKTVVNRIRNEWKIEKFTEEEIHTVCGYLEVNAFAVGDESLSIRGLYPTSFLIAHSCVPNTCHTDDDEYHMRIFTSVPIVSGDMITLSYTNSLQGTRKRREHLKQCKFFDCSCTRCKDPTELGTYLSALKCKECGSGHLLPTDPLTGNIPWNCDSKRCDAHMNTTDVERLVNRIESEIKAVDQNDIAALESTIRRYSDTLHKNHYLILGVKYTLSQLYGKVVGFLIHQMTESMLERKKQVCEDILSIFDVLEPGLSQIRALTMYELHAPIMVLTIQRFEMRKISKGDLCRRLRKVAAYLQECIKILKFDTPNSQEGSIRTAAEEALVQLKSWEPVVGKL